MWRPPIDTPLTTRQRWVAAVLIALILAAGVYRWVVFGDVNRLHGSGSQAVQTLTTRTSAP
jgi:hypothetical protein